MTDAGTIIVTGGGQGIGAATAKALAQDGYRVVVNFLENGVAAAAVVEDIVAAGGQATAVQADIADPKDVDRLFLEAGNFGKVTGLVNNAGCTLHIADLADTPVELIRRVLDVNLLGTVLCSRAAALTMSTKRGGSGGSIVNISSVAAMRGSPHEYTHYAAAKGGVEALTIGLAKELADQGVRVNAVAPGTVNTSIHAKAGNPERARQAAQRIPMGRAGDPEEIAAVVKWLMGDQASYVTGAIIKASGGA